MSAQSRRHLVTEHDDPWGFGAPEGTLVEVRYEPHIAAADRIAPVRREPTPGRREPAPSADAGAIDLTPGGGKAPGHVAHDPAGDARLQLAPPIEAYPDYFRPRRRHPRLVRAVLALGLAALAGGGLYFWFLGVTQRVTVSVPPGESESQHLLFDEPHAPIGASAPRGAEPAPARERPARAASPPVAAAASAPGFVTFDLPFAARVYESGTLLGSTSSRLRVAPGTHTFTVVSPELGFNVQETVVVTSDRTTRHVVEQVSAPLSVNAQPWAEVFIAGRTFGETPLANVSLPIGTYQVTLRHPTLGEREVAVTVRYGVANRLAVDMRP